MSMRSTYMMFVIVLLLGCSSPNEATATNTANENSAHPVVADEATAGASNFTLPKLEGGELSLSDFRGQYVLVNFWATWCIPCRKEMPYLQAISEKHSDQMVVLGVNMGEDAARVQPFVDEMALTFPILLDPPDALIQAHNVRGLPVSFIVGPDGQIVYRRIGEILPEEFDVWLAEHL